MPKHNHITKTFQTNIAQQIDRIFKQFITYSQNNKLFCNKDLFIFNQKSV